jgi:hypothetical protein
MMPDIKLVINNRTNLDLIFVYNEIKHVVSAGRSERLMVKTGHRISVHDPNHTKVTKRKISVEPDFFIYDLSDNTTIDCNLIGWQLSLSLGVDLR